MTANVFSYIPMHDMIIDACTGRLCGNSARSPRRGTSTFDCTVVSRQLFKNMHLVAENLAKRAPNGENELRTVVTWASFSKFGIGPAFLFGLRLDVGGSLSLSIHHTESTKYQI